MASKVPPSDLPIHPFRSAKDFESFLDREHSGCPGIYLKLAKKSANIKSISSAEALEVALCFGWINGQGRPFDGHWYLSRYTPRRPKSLWSKINVNTVARLAEAGRMRPAGLAAVEAAKADGRWDRAYAGPATVQVPDDFRTALGQDPAASSFFEGLDKTSRYAVLWRVETASTQARAKRIETLVNSLADGKVPGRPEPAVKPKRKAELKAAGTTSAAQVSRKARKQAGTSSPCHDDQARVLRRTGLRARP